MVVAVYPGGQRAGAGGHGHDHHPHSHRHVQQRQEISQNEIFM